VSETVSWELGPEDSVCVTGAAHSWELGRERVSRVERWLCSDCAAVVVPVELLSSGQWLIRYREGVRL